MKTYKLEATTQKSYYGKAVIIEEKDDFSGETLLKSYETIVCKVTAGGVFVKLWNGYSRTTMNHVNDFRRLFGMPTLNKSAWMALPCESGNGERYKVTFTNGFVTWTAEAVFDDEEAAEDFGETVARGRYPRLTYWTEAV